MVTYFYGNGPLMANILTAIVYILNSADYATLLTLMMTLAGALTILDWHKTNVTGGLGFHSVMLDVGLVVLLYYGAWAPKTSIVVSDPLNNFQTAVNNVPEGFAVIVYTSNKITNGFADLFEQGFGTTNFPNAMDYQNGMTPGLISIASLGDLQPQDQFLMENISEYFSKCVFPAMLMGNGAGPTVNDLATSTNLLQTIKTSLSNAWVANYYSEQYPQGQSVYCSSSGGTPDLYDNLVTDINNAINNPTGSISQAYANQMLMGFAGATQYSNPTTDQNLLLTADNYMLAGGSTSANLLAQAVLINGFNPALQQFAASNGMNINALSSSLTQNVLQSTTSMSLSYLLAQQLLPIAFLVVSALIYSILPIVFAMMFIPQLTRKFGLMAFDLLMWIAFWAPLAAVINDITQSVSANGWSGFGTSITAMNNWGYMMAHTHVMMAIAGDMMFSVPVLAFALASGSSYAMTAVAGSITGLGRSAANSAAGQMTTRSGIDSTIAGAQGSTSGLGAADAENNLHEGLYDVEQNAANAQATNFVATLDTYKHFGFNQMASAAENQKAHSVGSGNVYGFGPGGMDNAANIGSATQEVSNASAIGKYQGYGGNMQEAQAMSAMNTLQNLRQNRGFMQLMQNGHMLPSNFNSLSEPQQIKALANGMTQLGSGAQNVYLTAQQAQEIFHNKNMGAGTYSVGFNKNGQAVQVVGKGGADIFEVTPNGVVQADSQIASGNRVLNPVMQTTRRGEVTSEYDNVFNKQFGYNITGDNINTYNTSSGNKSINNDSENNISRGNKSINNDSENNISRGNVSLNNYSADNTSQGGFSVGGVGAALLNPKSQSAQQVFKNYRDLSYRNPEAAKKLLTDSIQQVTGFKQSADKKNSFSRKTELSSTERFALNAAPIALEIAGGLAGTLIEPGGGSVAGAAAGMALGATLQKSLELQFSSSYTHSTDGSTTASQSVVTDNASQVIMKSFTGNPRVDLNRASNMIRALNSINSKSTNESMQAPTLNISDIRNYSRT